MINKLPNVCMNCDRADFDLSYYEAHDFFGNMERTYTIKCNKDDVCSHLNNNLDMDLDVWNKES